MKRRRHWESESDSQLRSGLGGVLGAFMALIPVLSHRLEFQSFLLASVIGMVAVVPFWRQIGGPIVSQRAGLGFLVFVVGALVAAGLFSAIAILSYVGAWAFSLGTIRFLKKWRY